MTETTQNNSTPAKEHSIHIESKVVEDTKIPLDVNVAHIIIMIRPEAHKVSE